MEGLVPLMLPRPEDVLLACVRDCIALEIGGAFDILVEVLGGKVAESTVPDLDLDLASFSEARSCGLMTDSDHPYSMFDIPPTNGWLLSLADQ